jgi:hypothetical protein
MEASFTLGKMKSIGRKIIYAAHKVVFLKKQGTSSTLFELKFKVVIKHRSTYCVILTSNLKNHR